VIEYLAEEANPPPDGSTAGSRAGDGSWIRQKFVKLVATATATIASIDSPTTAHIVARSARAGSESPPCNDGDLIDPGSIAITQVPGGPVRSVALIGDTGGKDISKDDDCRCDTRVNDLVFNEVAFTLAGGSPFLDTEAGPPIPEPDPGPGSVPVGPVVPLEWRAGAWGACMDHMQTRSVRCVESGTGTVVPDMRCTTPRPRDTRPCGGSYCSGSTSSDPGVTGQIALCMYESSGGPRIGDCIPTHCDGDTLHQWGCHYDTGVGGMVINPTTIPLPCGAAFPAGGRCRAYTADDGQRGSACVAP